MTRREPKLRRHTTRGLGHVELCGIRHYLGRFDDPETIVLYHKLLAPRAPR
jgi:hypothetical protein